MHARAGLRRCYFVATTSGWKSRRHSRDAIWSLNMFRIAMADAVFAWIDEQDCFGTLAEIGWAARGNKYVGPAFGPNLGRGDGGKVIG